MDFLSNIIDIRVIQLVACTGACVLALLLMLIKIPHTEYSKRLGNAKNIIAGSFLVFAALMIYTLITNVGFSEVRPYEKFSSLTMLIAASISSMSISYSMIKILDDNALSESIFFLNILIITVISYALIRSFFIRSHAFYITVLVINIVVFLLHSLFHILAFHKAYTKAAKEVNAYYDEDEDHKIRWVRFCYIIAMLTDLFLLVYMLMPNSFMKIYIAWYLLFLLYFTSNFISFIGSHKLVLDAFAHGVLSGKDILPQKKRKAKEAPQVELDSRKTRKEFTKLEANLRKWVAEQRYREYDKSREEIADELDTTKELLQIYFATVKKQDFRSWRTSLRIEDAKKMLLENMEYSPNAVGELCGFSDRSNFHKQFIKFVGCSPKEWREKGGKLN